MKKILLLIAIVTISSCTGEVEDKISNPEESLSFLEYHSLVNSVDTVRVYRVNDNLLYIDPNNDINEAIVITESKNSSVEMESVFLTVIIFLILGILIGLLIANN